MSAPPPASAIVPAAGRSRRMGRPKLLLPYGGGKVIEATLAALRGAGVAPIVVVAGVEDAPLRAWCAAVAGPSAGVPPETAAQPRREAAASVSRSATAAEGVTKERPLILALNPAPERGMLSSIVEGLLAMGGASALARGGRPLLICPGDLPALRAPTVIGLLRAQEAARASLAVPAWRGRRGHPLLIAPALLPEIERLDPARGLRELLDLHAGDLLTVEVDDPGCIADLDTPEDYERLLAGA